MPEDLDRHTPELDQAKLDDDDTSAGRITQGGRGGRRGKSIWWVAVLLVLVVGAIFTWAAQHKDGPVESHTAPISGTADNPG